MERRDSIYHQVLPDGRHSTVIDGQRFVDIGGGPPVNKKIIPIDRTQPRMIGEARPRRKTAEEIMREWFCD